MGLLGVSENGGFSTQIIHGLIGVSIINHPFWGKNPIFGNTHILIMSYHVLSVLICGLILVAFGQGSDGSGPVVVHHEHHAGEAYPSC